MQEKDLKQNDTMSDKSKVIAAIIVFGLMSLGIAFSLSMDHFSSPAAMSRNGIVVDKGVRSPEERRSENHRQDENTRESSRSDSNRRSDADGNRRSDTNREQANTSEEDSQERIPRNRHYIKIEYRYFREINTREINVPQEIYEKVIIGQPYSLYEQEIRETRRRNRESARGGT